MAVPAFTAPPTTPLRSDRATFNSRFDAIMDWEDVFVTEIPPLEAYFAAKAPVSGAASQAAYVITGKGTPSYGALRIQSTEDMGWYYASDGTIAYGSDGEEYGSIGPAGIGFRGTYINNGAGAVASNLAIGAGSPLGALTTGTDNTAIGTAAGFALTTDPKNVVIGYHAMETSWGGTSNVVIGNNAAALHFGSVRNTIIGHGAAAALTTGQRNVIIGSGAGATMTTATECVVIGYQADASSPGATNEVTLGNSAITKFRVLGIGLNIDADTITMPGTSTPASAGATGTINSVAVDANYLYICTATNTWKRLALTGGYGGGI